MSFFYANAANVLLTRKMFTALNMGVYILPDRENMVTARVSDK